jgi:hypothetical protein
LLRALLGDNAAAVGVWIVRHTAGAHATGEGDLMRVRRPSRIGGGRATTTCRRQQDQAGRGTEGCRGTRSCRPWSAFGFDTTPPSGGVNRRTGAPIGRFAEKCPRREGGQEDGRSFHACSCTPGHVTSALHAMSGRCHADEPQMNVGRSISCSTSASGTGDFHVSVVSVALVRHLTSGEAQTYAFGGIPMLAGNTCSHSCTFALNFGELMLTPAACASKTSLPDRGWDRASWTPLQGAFTGRIFVAAFWICWSTA